MYTKNSNIFSSKRPIRVIQFGGGVFLRGFFDWMLQKANDAGLMCADAYIVRSRTRGPDPLASHGYRYTHIARDGAKHDVTPVDCVAGSLDASSDPDAYAALACLDTVDIIVSNTTEAGIVYRPCPRPTAALPDTYPAKLTHLLWLRHRASLPAPLILPCELIEHGGDTLRDIVLRHAEDWGLGSAFVRYITDECRFCNTLVDRIVSGSPADAPDGQSINESEHFHLFVIEGEPDARLPFAELGLNVRWVPDITPYHTLKVRILNGAHTASIPYALCNGISTVGDMMQDKTLRAHVLTALYDEIIPTLDMDAQEARAYADDVVRRFENPYLHHACEAIAQNSVSKFRVRVLPSLLAYREKFGKPPKQLCLALSKLIELYRTAPPRDEAEALDAMQDSSVADILSNTALWGVDLSDFTEEVSRHVH